MYNFYKLKAFVSKNKIYRSDAKWYRNIKREKSNSPWEKQRKVGDPNCSLKDDCVFIAAKISLSLL